MTEPQRPGPPPAPGGPSPGAPAPGAPAPGAPVPGWYPDPATGALRWWDGQAWGQLAAPAGPMPPGAWAPAPGSGPPPPGYYAPPAPGAAASNARSTAMLAHLLGWLTGFIGPLIIMLTAGKDDPFAKDQSTEALNFQLTVLIGMLVSVVLALVLVGFVLMIVIAIANVVLCIQGAMAANRGEWYRYPLNIRMVK
ncbi:MAG: DUF4870 domain-containing protein [Acidimicrobiales bacterium]